MHESLIWVMMPTMTQRQMVTQEEVQSYLDPYNLNHHLDAEYPHEEGEEAWDYTYNPQAKFDFCCLLGHNYEVPEEDAEKEPIYLETAEHIQPILLCDAVIDLYTLIGVKDSWALTQQLPVALVTPKGGWVELFTDERKRELNAWDYDLPGERMESRMILAQHLEEMSVLFLLYQDAFMVRVRTVG